MINCENRTPSEVFRDQLTEKPDLESRLAFYAMWIDAVDQTSDFENSFSNEFRKRNIQNDPNIGKYKTRGFEASHLGKFFNELLPVNKL